MKAVKSKLCDGALNHKQEARHPLNEGAANINNIDVLNPKREVKTLR
jgi:hypothetical protein